MRFILTSETMRDPASTVALDRLLSTVEDRWHVLIADLSATRSTSWFRGLRPQRQESLKGSLSRSAYAELRRPERGPHRAEITVLPVGKKPESSGDDREG